MSGKIIVVCQKCVFKSQVFTEIYARFTLVSAEIYAVYTHNSTTTLFAKAKSIVKVQLDVYSHAYKYTQFVA